MNALNAAQRMQMIEKFETLTISEYEALVSVNEQLRRRVQELEELLKESYKDADEVLRPRVAELEKERDELLEVFQLVISEMKHRDRNDGNAPGHGHSIPGVWDSDNGALAGKPCAWCAVWKKAKEICADIASVKEK